MGLDPSDLEGCAEALYKLAGLQVDEPVSPAKIARLILGPRAIEVTPMRASAGAIVTVNGETRIALRRGLPLLLARFITAHELAHLIVDRLGMHLGEDLETACDYIAGAVLMPRRHYVSAHKFHDGDVRELAEEYSVTHSAAWLRVGETVRIPLALVRPGLVRTRGPESYVWPEENTILGWSRGAPPRGLAKTRVADDPRRTVLVADDQEETG